jgi:hypothetical protein
MRIFLPFNSEYFLGRYFDRELVNKIETEVIPYIIQRHSSSEYVKNIDIFSNSNYSEMELFSTKVRYINNNSYFGENFVELVDNYIKVTSGNDEVLAYHNPLFPFVSLEKMIDAYEFVKKNNDCIINSKVGVFSKGVENLSVDLGAVSVFTHATLKKNGTRNSLCEEDIELTALEMLCLRTSGDLELFNLIVNSGFRI